MQRKERRKFVAAEIGDLCKPKTSRKKKNRKFVHKIDESWFYKVHD